MLTGTLSGDEKSPLSSAGKIIWFFIPNRKQRGKKITTLCTQTHSVGVLSVQQTQRQQTPLPGLGFAAEKEETFSWRAGAKQGLWAVLGWNLCRLVGALSVGVTEGSGKQGSILPAFLSCQHFQEHTWCDRNGTFFASRVVFLACQPGWRLTERLSLHLVDRAEMVSAAWKLTGTVLSWSGSILPHGTARDATTIGPSLASGVHWGCLSFSYLPLSCVASLSIIAAAYCREFGVILTGLMSLAYITRDFNKVLLLAFGLLEETELSSTSHVYEGCNCVAFVPRPPLKGARHQLLALPAFCISFREAVMHFWAAKQQAADITGMVWA